MTRFRAAQLHLLISAIVVSAVLAFAIVTWYPPPLFSAAGGKTILMIMAGIDVVLGPLLTLLVFRPGKRSLRFDLICIAVLQVCALTYGVYTVFMARPVFLVFAVDRFEVVTAAEIPPEEQAKALVPEYRYSPLWRYRTVAAELPHDLAEQQRILFISVLGADIQDFPQHYRPFDAAMARTALSRASDIAYLRLQNPEKHGEIERWLKEHALAPENVALLPVRARDRDLVAVLDRAGDQTVVLLAPFTLW